MPQSRNLRARPIGRKDITQFIRDALKANFPKTKFSVRTEQRAATLAVSLQWLDGPTPAEVDGTIAEFKTLSTNPLTRAPGSPTRWLLPDGSTLSAAPTADQTTAGGNGLCALTRPDPAAELVSIGSVSIATIRNTTGPFRKEVFDQFVAKYGLSDLKWDPRYNGKPAQNYFSSQLGGWTQDLFTNELYATCESPRPRSPRQPRP